MPSVIWEILDTVKNIDFLSNELVSFAQPAEVNKNICQFVIRKRHY